MSETHMSGKENIAKIKEFFSRNFRNAQIEENQDIFALGFVNSLFAMQLVMFVEKEFGIKVEDEDLELDNFRTVNAIQSLIERKKGHSSSPLPTKVSG